MLACMLLLLLLLAFAGLCIAIAFHFEHLENLFYTFVVEAALFRLIEQLNRLGVRGRRFLFIFLGALRSEGLDHVAELSRNNYIIFAALEAEHHQEYESLQLGAIVVVHFVEFFYKTFILHDDLFVLLHQHRYQILQPVMLFS